MRGAATPEMDITDKTRVGLFAVLGALPVIIGGIFWLSMIYFKAEAAERMNEKQEQKLDSQMAILLDIRDRVIRLENYRAIHKEK